MNLNTYMARGMASLTRTAARFYLNHESGRRFLAEFIPALETSRQIRLEHERTGMHIPPFLIASISARCNLHCAGCYARAAGACASETAAAELGAGEWRDIFHQAEQLGVSFILLAGGEPLLRPEILDAAATFSHIVFPVFTNGTLISDDYVRLFDTCRNLIPVLSVEGSTRETDLRRGRGVSGKIELAMARLKEKNILFGVSVTVTTRNLYALTDRAYVSDLRSRGCGVVFYVEYVPAEAGTEHLVLSEQDTVLLTTRLSALRRGRKTISLIAFPGDEQYMGGCLAAGRGFFHINSSGGAEPCPFSPYSELNLKYHTMLEVLRSPFFARIQSIGHAAAQQHAGGCALFSHRQEVLEAIETTHVSVCD